MFLCLFVFLKRNQDSMGNEKRAKLEVRAEDQMRQRKRDLERAHVSGNHQIKLEHILVNNKVHLLGSVGRGSPSWPQFTRTPTH